MKYVIARNCENEDCEHLSFVHDEEGKTLEFDTKKEAKDFKTIVILQELEEIHRVAAQELEEDIMIMPKEEK
tara:strand:+ start:2420 stop:2635 length:216 start_codon:yes stop_codon:yes gene_type:complete